MRWRRVALALRNLWPHTLLGCVVIVVLAMTHPPAIPCALFLAGGLVLAMMGLTALLIFILMVAVQFRSPNKERFWKKVIDEAGRWAWLYRPLAAIDRGLIAILPFLGPLCWNVVIVAKCPHKTSA